MYTAFKIEGEQTGYRVWTKIVIVLVKGHQASLNSSRSISMWGSLCSPNYTVTTGA